MKSTLFFGLIALAISSSFAVKIKGSCPNPVQPKVDDWSFSYFIREWTVYGRSEETVPRTVYNTLEIRHLYPGKIAVIEQGNTRDIEVVSVFDLYIDMTVGDFDGEEYYYVQTAVYEPYTFNFTTPDGHRGQFWMPYYANTKYQEALLASCVKIDESTFDIKTWFVSTSGNVGAPQQVLDLVKSLTGQELIDVCQGDFC
ncbi:uncharacterized protein LOC107359483 [Tetranychus urticae]|uniref:Lipocalin/cytosolic fatty-acid binding domain-containing protein n=1 Tax=Tetranychus urticae TaxID=32264 RepID=T1K3P5_TETUR|nr:uncharacterized protein LOC107359483 [Tetranychus urticae]